METIKIGKKLAYTFAMLVVLFTGCKKDDEEVPKPTPGEDPKPVENTLTAYAGKDTTIQVGTLLTLDGTVSKDSDNQPFNYQWVLLSKPSTSSLSLKEASTSKPSLTPDEVGDYEIELTISNSANQHKDRMKVHAIVATPQTIDKSIEVNTVLEDRISNPAYPDYVVTRDIAVTAELTIKPGVVIAFERNVRFSLERDGLVIAKGTADKKIKFTGVENTAGYWRGFIIYSISNANILEHVEISNTGSSVMLSGKKSALTVFGYQAQIALRNSTISDNEGYGMFVSDGGIIRDFVQNNFARNTEAGILLASDNVSKLDYASSFTGENGRDVVEVYGTYIKDANDAEIVWAGFNDKTPYLITTDLSAKSVGN